MKEKPTQTTTFDRPSLESVQGECIGVKNRTTYTFEYDEEIPPLEFIERGELNEFEDWILENVDKDKKDVITASVRSRGGCTRRSGTHGYLINRKNVERELVKTLEERIGHDTLIQYGIESHYDVEPHMETWNVVALEVTVMEFQDNEYPTGLKRWPLE